MSESYRPFVPFWATKQYGGGLLQGIALTLFSLFLLHLISASFFERYTTAIGVIGLVLLILGGIQARRTGAGIAKERDIPHILALTGRT